MINNVLNTIDVLAQILMTGKEFICNNDVYFMR